MNGEKTGYRWVILACVSLINCLASGFMMGTMALLLPEIAEELSLTHTQIGTIWGALYIGMMLFSVVGGNFGDRFGAKRVITPALAGGAILCAARALFPSFWGLSIIMFLLGASQVFIIPNLTKIVGEWFGSEELGKANGILIIGVTTGMAIGAMLGASVLSPVLGGWKGVMWLTGGVTAMLLPMWMILAKERQSTKATVGPSLAQSGSLRGLRSILRIRDLWLLAITEFCITGGILAWSGMFPDILVSKGMSAGMAGFFISISSWVAMPFNIVGPHISDRLRIRKLFIWPFLIVLTMSYSLQTFLMGAPLACIIAVSGMAKGMVLPLARTVTLEVEGVRPQLGGSAIGLMFLLNRLGASLLPIIMGVLLDYTGLYWTPLAALAILSLIGASCIFLVRETGTKASPEAGWY